MRIAIITGTSPHHKHLCAVLTEAFEVVGIIHPLETRPSKFDSIRRLGRRRKNQGFALAGLHLLSKLRPLPQSAQDDDKLDCFAESDSAYQRIDHSLIHHRCDIRQPSSHALLRSLRPDVTLCLGGPVYPADLIRASPLTLNFHSGISPIYNGTASIQFAFANGHPHLCGGTLMIMNESVDGGGILGHYLPAVVSGDSPRSLFNKTVRGATLMYVRLLNHMATKGNTLPAIPQSAPLFYTRGMDFSWYHSLVIAQNFRLNIAAKYLRQESFREYWSAENASEAERLYQSTLNNLLWAGPVPKKT